MIAQCHQGPCVTNVRYFMRHRRTEVPDVRALESSINRANFLHIMFLYGNARLL